MILAINKHGTVGEFSETAWRLLGKNKGGWTEYDGVNKVVNVPQQIIEFQAKKKEAAIAKVSLTIDDIKDYLTANDIKFHPKTGYDKLKLLYDANQK